MRPAAFAAVIAAPFIYALPAHALTFTPGDLVVSLVGNVDGMGTTYFNSTEAAVQNGGTNDNQASPILLQQLTPTGALAGSLELPQTASGANYAISGEYGSSTESLLHNSADGHSLVIGGYGVNAQTYNAADSGTARTGTASNTTYGDARLAQSTSLSSPTGGLTAVPRVVASVSATGAVNTSTGIYNFANTNNIRSVATVNGSSFYVAGQGVKGDTTQGVFLVQAGVTTTTPTPIDTSTDFRSVTIQNGQLVASRDSTQGTNTTQINQFNPALPTTSTGTTDPNLAGFGPTVTVTAQNENAGNLSRLGKTVYLSPEDYVFVSSGGNQYAYIADSGNPKSGSTGAAQLGDGGVQKWELMGSTWTELYDISAGLGIVPKAVGSTAVTNGTSGAIGLAVQVVNGMANIYATNSTLGDLDPTALYFTTDPIAQSSITGTPYLLTAAAPNDYFTAIFNAPVGTNVRGIAFAPTAAVPEPASLVLLPTAIGIAAMLRRRKQNQADPSATC